MMKVLLAGAGLLALVSTAALADPTADAQTKPANAQVKTEAMPAYAPQSAESAMPLTPADVTTKSESRALAKNEFMLADVNADGVLNESEFVAFTEGAASIGKDTSLAAKEAKPAEEAFAEIAKADQKISEEELADARAASFEKADANSDDKLDAIEKQQFAALIVVKAPDSANAQ